MDYLDRKIDLAIEATEARLSMPQALEVYPDLLALHSWVTEYRPFSESKFQDRAKKMLVLATRLCRVLDTRSLSRLREMQDELLSNIARKP